MSDINKRIAETFLEIAEGLETGHFGKKSKVAVMGLGSEHGEDNMLQGAIAAAKAGVSVVYIGTKSHESLECVYVETEEECHAAMDRILEEKKADAAVAMHYPFPIGVSTVGRTIVPANGKEIFVSTTTGTSSTDRIEGMVLNSIYGVICAKACGIEKPTLGFLNIDGARQTERIMKELAKNGYDICFAESQRADGGCVLRGNDVLTAAADIVVTDPLTGNVLIKMLSSFVSGGSYEAVGYGYGPGVGRNYDKLIFIVSRASGSAVVSGAIKYAADIVNGGYTKICKQEFEKADKAGLKTLLEQLKAEKTNVATEEVVKAPPEEVATGQISGIEIMDLENAVHVLWKAGIYAKSGMGCTGPIVLVSEEKLEKATQILTEASFL